MRLSLARWMGPRLACIALAIYTAAYAAAQTVDNQPVVKQEILDLITDDITKNAFVPGLDFQKWPDFLKQEQPKLDAAANDEEFQRAVNEALRKFGATHMNLIAPRTAQQQSNATSVGIGIGSRRTADGLLVTRTVPDAPAERAGIVPGDVIIAVDDKPTQGAASMSGREGTDVKVTVRHADKTQEDYILTRRKFSTVRPEELTWIDKDTAKLTIYSFDYTYKHPHVEELMKDAEGSKSLILDLRDNGGGTIANFRRLLGLFVSPTQAVGTFIDKRMVDDYTAATHGNPTDLPTIAKWSPRKLRPIPSETLPVYKGRVIVLVNRQSGSASEIVAAGLRDVIGATVVGSRSAGAVLVSSYVDVTHGFVLQFPMSDYVTIKGVRLEGVGVTPDVTATDPRFQSASAPDDALKKAVQLLATAKSVD